MIRVTVSGGSGREQFVWQGAKISRSKLLAELNAKLGDRFQFSLSPSRQTQIILLPDDIDEPSETKQNKAPHAKWEHLGHFLAEHALSLSKSKKASTKTKKKPQKRTKAEIRAEIKALSEAMSRMQIEMNALKAQLE